MFRFAGHAKAGRDSDMGKSVEWFVNEYLSFVLDKGDAGESVPDARDEKTGWSRLGGRTLIPSGQTRIE